MHVDHFRTQTKQKVALILLTCCFKHIFHLHKHVREHPQHHVVKVSYASPDFSQPQVLGLYRITDLSKLFLDEMNHQSKNNSLSLQRPQREQLVDDYSRLRWHLSQRDEQTVQAVRIRTM